MACNMKMMSLMVLSMVLMSMTGVQSQNFSNYPCIQALIPCTPALNTTGTPPAACCGPLKNAFKTQLSCLCAVFQNTQLHNSVNVSITEARKIPARCGINGVETMCAAEGPSPASSPVAGGPMSSSPVAGGPMSSSFAPGAGGPEAGGPGSSSGVASTPTMTPGNSGAKSVASAGSFSGLMLLLAGLMFY